MKKNIKIIITLFFIILLANNILWFVYNKNSSSEKRITSNGVDSLISVTKNYISPLSCFYLKKDILLNGDIKAYNEISEILNNNDLNDSRLFWSIIMANKYNYYQAFYNAFVDMAMIRYYECKNESTATFSRIESNDDGIYYISLDHLDEKTRSMALEYLVKASEKNVKDAKKELGAYYLIGKYFPKNEELGKKLIEESKE